MAHCGDKDTDRGGTGNFLIKKNFYSYLLFDCVFIYLYSYYFLFFFAVVALFCFAIVSFLLSCFLIYFKNFPILLHILFFVMVLLFSVRCFLKREDENFILYFS